MSDYETRAVVGQRLQTYGLNNTIVHNGPKHQRFASFESRMETFREWPQAMPLRPKELSEAGFFYLGKNVTDSQI